MASGDKKIQYISNITKKIFPHKIDFQLKDKKALKFATNWAKSQSMQNPNYFIVFNLFSKFLAHIYCPYIKEFLSWLHVASQKYRYDFLTSVSPTHLLACGLLLQNLLSSYTLLLRKIKLEKFMFLFEKNNLPFIH